MIRVVRTTRSPGTLGGKGKAGSSMVHLQLIPPSPKAGQDSFDKKVGKKRKSKLRAPNSKLFKQRHNSFESQPKSP